MGRITLPGADLQGMDQRGRIFGGFGILADIPIYGKYGVRVSTFTMTAVNKMPEQGAVEIAYIGVRLSVKRRIKKTVGSTSLVISEFQIIDELIFIRGQFGIAGAIESTIE